MAAFYADENFRYPVVTALRLLGHDVLTCQEAGRADQGIDDATVLADAHRMDRILLTQNRNDFKNLHRKGLPTRALSSAPMTRTPRHSPCESPMPWPGTNPAGAGLQVSSGRTREEARPGGSCNGGKLRKPREAYRPDPAAEGDQEKPPESLP